MTPRITPPYATRRKMSDLLKNFNGNFLKLLKKGLKTVTIKKKAYTNDGQGDKHAVSSREGI